MNKNKQILIKQKTGISIINCQLSIKLLFISFFLINFLSAQQISLLLQPKNISFRGLSVVNDSVVWVSGNKGTIAKTTNGGKTFTLQTIKGFETADFRDIEAYDSNVAIAMAVTNPSTIIKTKDGGKNWYKVFEDTAKEMFLDAMDFIDAEGIVVGDPINNKLFIATTKDSGEHWQKEVITNGLTTSKGEACFAASGTNVKMVKTFDWNPIFVVTGGTQSNLLEVSTQQKLSKLPLLQGNETSGANSIDILNGKCIAVGGNFSNDTLSKNNCILFNGGTTSVMEYTTPTTPPKGYKSCVIFVTEQQLITCGTSGVDISNDAGMNWKQFSKLSFNVVQKAKYGSKVFIAGKEKIGVVVD